MKSIRRTPPAGPFLNGQRLVQGVQRKEEVELIAGSGYPGVNGILNRSAGFTAPQTVAALTNLVVPSAGTAGAGAASSRRQIEATPGRQIKGTGTTGTRPPVWPGRVSIFQALTDIRVQHFFEPDAIVMNPLDYITVRLSKDVNQQYYGGSMFGADYGYPQNETPGGTATARFGLWAKPVVTTPAMPQGLVLVGDFADYNRVLRRGGLRPDPNTNTDTIRFHYRSLRARRRAHWADG